LLKAIKFALYGFFYDWPHLVSLTPHWCNQIKRHEIILFN
jgi:hypothetical protein